MATPIGHPFEFRATWGQRPDKPGDFLRENFSDRKTTSPDDVWIVDQTLFRQTHKEAVAGGQ